MTLTELARALALTVDDVFAAAPGICCPIFARVRRT